MSVFVMSNRNIIIPSPDGRTSIRLNRGQIGPVPAWAAKTAYFKALVADGKLVVSNSRDKDEEKARDEAEKARVAAEEAARKAAEEAGPQERPGDGDSPDSE